MGFFGEGFTYTKSGVSLENGVHRAKIIEVKPVQNDYGKHLEIKCEIDGLPLAYPNTFRIYERPTEGMTTKTGKTFTAEQRQHMWDAEQSKFFDSFNIPTEGVNPFKTFNSWVGKEGAVTVQNQKSNPEYKEVVPYAKTVKEEPKPAPAPAPSNADGFPEDICF